MAIEEEEEDELLAEKNDFKEEITPRLEKLFEKDKYAPAAVAVRAALRVFPLLALPGDFYYWKDKQDNRIVYLLTLFNKWKNALTLIGYSFHVHKNTAISIFTDVQDIPSVTTSAISSNSVYTNDSSGPVFVFSSIYSSITSSSSSATDAATSAAIDAISFSIDAISFSTYIRVNYVIDSILDDINKMDKGLSPKELLREDLWVNKESSVHIIELWDNEFRKAVENLIEEKNLDGTKEAHLLQQMITDYDSILSNSMDYKASVKNIPDQGNVTEDKLGRSALVNALAERIKFRKNTDHTTIGLFGHWGVGKSAVISLVKEKLAQDKSFIFGEFNAWSYENCGNIQAGMAQEAITALSSMEAIYESRKCSNLRWELPRLRLIIRFAWRIYGKRFWIPAFTIIFALLAIVADKLGLCGFDLKKVINPFYNTVPRQVASTGGLLAVLIYIFKQFRVVFTHGLTKELKSYLKLPDYKKEMGTVPVMREQIRSLCEVRLGDPKNKNHKRLFFVVDDLDRCNKDGIVKTLEALRLVMDLPLVTVVIAVDQRIALAALAQKYEPLAKYHPTGEPLSIARDYLAKMVHLPITLDEPDSTVVKGYLDYIWGGEDATDWRNQLEEKIDVKEIKDTDNIKSEDESEIDIKNTDSDDGKKKKQSLEDIMKSLEELSTLTLNKKDVFGLNDKQKASFFLLSDQYGLNNPRQLKRLHNSYNLIRLLLQKGAESGGNMTSDDPPFTMKNITGTKYPVMLALFLLEYLNSIDCAKDRENLHKALVSGEEFPKTDIDHKLKDNEREILLKGSAVLFNQSKVDVNEEDKKRAVKALLDFVKPFVLPAIERCNTKQEDKN